MSEADLRALGEEYKYHFVDEVKPVFVAERGLTRRAVSYTHLTLPTIYSV